MMTCSSDPQGHHDTHIVNRHDHHNYNPRIGMFACACADEDEQQEPGVTRKGHVTIKELNGDEEDEGEDEEEEEEEEESEEEEEEKPAAKVGSNWLVNLFGVGGWQAHPIPHCDPALIPVAS